MSIRVSVLLFVALAAAGCENGESVTLDVSHGDFGTTDGTAGLELTADTAAGDLPVELADLPLDGIGDATGEVDATPPCQPGEGCHGEECGEDADCQSGLCVQHQGIGVCTSLCDASDGEACPEGWSCEEVDDGQGGSVHLCLSLQAALCLPCLDDAGCDLPDSPAIGARCVTYGPPGSFCGAVCETNDNCPEGYTCQDAQTVDGDTSSQCVADAAACGCTEIAVELELKTGCFVENDYGTCEGERLCTEDGLSDCDASVPAADECNGLDDNCDGETDEVPCDDANPCTADSCDGEAGECQFVPDDEATCEDGDPCTIKDQCQAGFCAGEPLLCDDTNVCTDDVCAEGECVYTANAAACDDEDTCTLEDQCKETECVGVFVFCECDIDEDCAALEDGDLCNGTLFCDTETLPHQCEVVEESIIECPQAEGPDAFCVEPACDAETGECGFLPVHEGMPCEDGDPCTAATTCVEGGCANGSNANCNDGNLCTDDACEPGIGCIHTPNEQPCNDDDVCTTGDNCTNAECVGAGVLDCDDSNVCTDDTCDLTTGCQHVANTAGCDDGNACTQNDVCFAGQCKAGEAVLCDDGDLCTDDGCDINQGCVYLPNSVPCDDGNSCSLNDTCQDGECQGTEMLECDDGNPCTNDLCDSGIGCTYVFNEEPCDDSNPCTTGDVCSAGTCIAGGTDTCDDGNLCTTDYCDPVAGCVNESNIVTVHLVSTMASMAA